MEDLHLGSFSMVGEIFTSAQSWLQQERHLALRRLMSVVTSLSAEFISINSLI